MNAPVDVRSLEVRIAGGRRLVGPLDLRLEPGRVHAIVGESGSGKTLTLRALAGVVPEGLSAGWNDATVPEAMPPGAVHADGGGDGRAAATPAPTESPRSEIPRTAMVFQDPASFFNPRWRVERSLREVLRYARGLRRSAVPQRIATLASQVGLSLEEFRRYPFELSGGMVQRAAIAMALAPEPTVLLADEITSALDPERAERILEMLHGIAVAQRIAVVLVSHDLPLVARVSDDVRVLYRGVVVEKGAPAAVLSRPMHRYTDLLVRALPSQAQRGRALPEIDPAPSEEVGAGCPFLGRCPAASAACSVMPAWDDTDRVRCHHPVPGGPDDG